MDLERKILETIKDAVTALVPGLRTVEYAARRMHTIVAVKAQDGREFRITVEEV